jgi:uncharacterized radical SAM superfamily Fe-S cluster-containing enzyme
VGTPASVDDVLAKLTAIRASDPVAIDVSFEGFEPFAHPELPRLVEGALEAGFERVRLTTDAGALAMGGNAAGSLAAGVRHVRFVLLGSTAGKHDSAAWQPGLFDLVERGVAMFRAAAADSGERVCVSALIPVCAHNVEVCPQTVATACRFGASYIEIDVAPSARASGGHIESALDSATMNGVGAVVRGWTPSSPVYLDRFARDIS